MEEPEPEEPPEAVPAELRLRVPEAEAEAVACPEAAPELLMEGEALAELQPEAVLEALSLAELDSLALFLLVLGWALPEALAGALAEPRLAVPLAEEEALALAALPRPEGEAVLLLEAVPEALRLPRGALLVTMTPMLHVTGSSRLPPQAVAMQPGDAECLAALGLSGSAGRGTNRPSASAAGGGDGGNGGGDIVHAKTPPYSSLVSRCIRPSSTYLPPSCQRMPTRRCSSHG